MGNGLVWFPFASVTVSSLSLHSSLLQMDISQIQTKLNLVCLTMISFLLNKLIDLKAVWCLFTMWPSKCPLSYLKPDEISEAFPLVLGFPLLWDVQAFSSRCSHSWDHAHTLLSPGPEKVPEFSLFGSDSVVCSFLNQYLWPGRYRILVGQAQSSAHPLIWGRSGF